MTQASNENGGTSNDGNVNYSVLQDKIAGLDKIIGHLISNARLGSGLVGLLLTAAGMLVSVFIALQVFVLVKIYDQNAAIITQSSVLQHQDENISRLQSEFDQLNMTLGEWPEILKEASQGISGAGAKITSASSRLEESSGVIAKAARKLDVLDRTLTTIERDVLETKSFLEDFEGEWTAGIKKVSFTGDQFTGIEKKVDEVLKETTARNLLLEKLLGAEKYKLMPEQ